MPKPASPPGKTKKEEKATKSVASIIKGKSVSVSVTVPSDELVQYDAEGIDALALAINALADALAAVRDDEESEVPEPAV